MRTSTMIALVGVAVLGLLAFTINSWSRLETLTCEREQIRVRCAVTRDAWFAKSEWKTYDDVVDLKATNFSRKWWEVELTERNGNADEVVKEIAEDEAKRIERWFLLREGPTLESARTRYPWHLSLLNVVFLGCLGLCIWGFRLERRNRRLEREPEVSPP